PARFLPRNFSSSISLHISAGTIATMTSNPHHEPSAIGMPRSITRAPAYIGCHLDGGRGKSIFFEHEKDGEPAERYKHVSDQGQIWRHARPGEAMIECGENHQANES